LVRLDAPINPWLGLVLLVIGYFLLPLEVVYAQRHLNRVWDRLAEPHP
jgi:hypothetical protein